MTARPGVPYAGLVTRSLALGIDLLAINAAIGVIGAVISLVASMLNLDLDADAVVVAALLGAWWLLVGCLPDPLLDAGRPDPGNVADAPASGGAETEGAPGWASPSCGWWEWCLRRSR